MPRTAETQLPHSLSGMRVCAAVQVKFAQQNWHDKLSVILEEFPKVSGHVQSRLYQHRPAAAQHNTARDTRTEASVPAWAQPWLATRSESQFGAPHQAALKGSCRRNQQPCPAACHQDSVAAAVCYAAGFADDSEYIACRKRLAANQIPAAVFGELPVQAADSQSVMTLMKRATHVLRYQRNS